jgi:hypothetical protein
MEFVAVFALSALVAIFYNFAISKWSQPAFLPANYFGKTLFTTVVIFAAIVAAGILFRLLDAEVAV